MKMNTLDRYRKIKHYPRQKNAEKKLFHPASILSGYRETWRLQKQVAFRFPGTARGGVASPWPHLF